MRRQVSVNVYCSATWFHDSNSNSNSDRDCDSNSDRDSDSNNDSTAPVWKEEG